MADQVENLELTGRSVTLKTTVEADREGLVAIRSIPEVQRRWRGEDLQVEFDDALDDDEAHRLTIRADASIVGLIQFAEEDDAEYRHASIDVYLDPAVHRRGIATDAIHTVVSYLFDQLGHHRLTVDPAADNVAAIECYASVGFQPVGVMREYEQQADGTWADGLLMELLARDH